MAAVNAWVDSVGGMTLTTISGLPTLRTFGFITGVQCLGQDALSGSRSPVDLSVVYVALFPSIGSFNTNRVVTMSLGAVIPLSLVNNIPTSGPHYQNEKIITDVGTFKFTINSASYVEIDLVEGLYNVYDWATGGLISSGHLPTTSPTHINTISVGDVGGLANSGEIVCRILGYSTVQQDEDRLQTLEYLTGTPIVFPYQPILNH